VWLLPEPVPLPERHSLPLHEGRPLQLLCGPERLESGWWDGALATRDYFVAQAADGALVWIFRTRLAAPEAPLADDAEAGWFLHGRFG
jgi:protein ImuB